MPRRDSPEDKLLPAEGAKTFFNITVSPLLATITVTPPLQTPSDWLIKYSPVRRRAGKRCLGGDDGEEEDDDEEEEWWWRPRRDVWLPW